MKYLTLLILTVALTASVFGQENKFDIGLEGSPSIIFLRGNDIIKQYHKPTVGFSSGLFLQYNFPKIFSLQTNIAFEKKGSVLYGTGVVPSTTHTNFDYMTMPILIRATIGKKIKYFINTGIFFGYLIKQTFVTTEPGFPTQTGDNTSRDKRFDTGVTAGLGFIIPVKGKFFISCEVRNNLGLYNVSAVPVINNGTVKTNSTNLLIGFAYKLGARQTETK